MIEVEMRRCGAEDLDALREIAIRTFRETFAPMNTPEDMEAYLEAAFDEDRLREDLADPCSEFRLMICDGRVAGYIRVNEAMSQTDINDVSSLEIERIYVALEFQGRGLGGRMIDWAIDTARERGKDYVWLGVWERNTGAIRFYKAHGFRVTGSHGFRIGDDVQTDLIMRRDVR